MYTSDKNKRITLRLNDAQFAHVKWQADILGVTPSEFLRMVINTAMASTQGLEEKIKANLEGQGRANDKANINNQL